MSFPSLQSPDLKVSLKKMRKWAQRGPESEKTMGRTPLFVFSLKYLVVRVHREEGGKDTSMLLTLDRQNSEVGGEGALGIQESPSSQGMTLLYPRRHYWVVLAFISSEH